MTDWRAARVAPRARGAGGWVRILRRGLPVALVLAAGLLILLAVRLPERLACGARRPATPWITQGVCRIVLVLIGLRVRWDGVAAVAPAVVVANHVSWLDVIVLNAGARVRFVAKSEVAGWSGIGWLARSTGTLFITRRSVEAGAQLAQLRAAVAEGQPVLLFPEGTSTDGQRVLPFKSTLFAAVTGPGALPGVAVQPVTLAYRPPAGEDPRIHGWWGDMAFGPHLLDLLARPRLGSAVVVRHPPLRADACPGRKALAAACEAAVRAAHPMV